MLPARRLYLPVVATATATHAETEAEQMRRVPGIEFVDTPTGRAARLRGTGVRVWLIVRDFRELAAGGCVDAGQLDDEQRAAPDAYGRAFPRRMQGPALAALWPWLTAQQIESALAYYAAFPEEIDRRIALEAVSTGPER